MTRALVTVVETAGFIASAAGLLSEEERAAVIEMLARDPECGDVIPGTGGLRKVRIRLAGRGKSGGARMIYFFLNEGTPVVALMVYAKNRTAQLTKAQEKELAAIASGIKKAKKEHT
ncbi:MAG TPA: type II toxin-antitoxin system RelE/ParE family toxin [Polyangia bacterium]